MEMTPVNVRPHVVERLDERVLIVHRYLERPSTKHITKAAFCCIALNCVEDGDIRGKPFVLEKDMCDGECGAVFAQNVKVSTW